MSKNSNRAAVSAGCAMLLAMSAGVAWAQEAPVPEPEVADAAPEAAETIGGWVFEEIISPLEGTRTLAAVSAPARSSWARR